MTARRKAKKSLALSMRACIMNATEIGAEEMNDQLKEAVKRLERACIAGMDEEYRDDLCAVLDELNARADAGGGVDARTQFEAWAEARGLDLQKQNYTKRYRSLLTAYAWAAWQTALAARQPMGHTVTVQLGAGLVKCDCGCGSDVCADCGQELGHLVHPAPPAVPVDDSPMAKMAAALRAKAAGEQEAFDRRVQSGEWGPLPDAGTQADFCQHCDGSGWDGESRVAVCPICQGAGIHPQPAAAKTGHLTTDEMLEATAVLRAQQAKPEVE